MSGPPAGPCRYTAFGGLMDGASAGPPTSIKCRAHRPAPVGTPPSAASWMGHRPVLPHPLNVGPTGRPLSVTPPSAASWMGHRPGPPHPLNVGPTGRDPQ